MHFIRRHWYNIGALVAIFTVAYLVADWHHGNMVRNLLLLNFVALLIHQFEEYGWPGGEPAIMNMVLRTSERPDRFPLNQNSAMVINVLGGYGFYLLPALFPTIVWLGIAPTFFGFGQFVVHGIVTNKKLRTFYNPGLGAVVFLHIPIGAYYLRYLSSHHLVTAFDWVAGIVYMAAFMYIAFVKMTYSWLADPNSRFTFDPVEMKRFGVQQKLLRIGK
jgi:hypothetical protein